MMVEPNVVGRRSRVPLIQFPGPLQGVSLFHSCERSSLVPAVIDRQRLTLRVALAGELVPHPGQARGAVRAARLTGPIIVGSYY